MAKHNKWKEMSMMGGHAPDPKRAAAFAEELGRLYGALRDRGYDDFEQTMMDFEARWISTATEWESLEIRRRIAEDLLMGAYVRSVDWPRFSRSLERIRALGYSNAERQVHVACLFARWAHSKRDHEQEARETLRDAGRCVAGNPDMSEMASVIAKTRADTGY